MSRMDRINEMMKREIGKIIQQDLQDPRFQFVSVIFVRVSPDLQNATVGFSFLGEKNQVEMVQQALTNAGGLVRHLISQRVELRHTPKIEFIYDPSLDYSAGVEEALEKIKREIPFEQDIENEDGVEQEDDEEDDGGDDDEEDDDSGENDEEKDLGFEEGETDET